MQLRFHTKVSTMHLNQILLEKEKSLLRVIVLLDLVMAINFINQQLSHSEPKMITYHIETAIYIYVNCMLIFISVNPATSQTTSRQSHMLDKI